MQKLSVAQLVGQLQRMLEVRLAALSEPKTPHGLVEGIQAVAEVALCGDLAVDAVLIHANQRVSIDGHQILQAARVRHVVAQSSGIPRDPEGGLAASNGTHERALVDFGPSTALHLQRDLATSHGRTQPANVLGLTELVHPDWVLHTVAHLSAPRELAPSCQAACDTGVRGTHLGIELRTRNLRQLVSAHREIVRLVAVELQLYVADALHGTLLGSLPRDAVRVPALSLDAEGGIRAEEARNPRLFVVDPEVEPSVRVQLRVVVCLQLAVRHRECDALLVVGDRREAHLRLQALHDFGELPLRGTLQGARLPLPAALDRIGGAVARQVAQSHRRPGQREKARGGRAHAR
mmetsp:Transcript_64226/g.178399  ORF Transcript_64226/g.178399 Transcript_64226/m.178399 type:complete len:349 (+) Transcript_64226:186-1232(+)